MILFTLIESVVKKTSPTKSIKASVTPVAVDEALASEQDSAWKEMLDEYLPAFLEQFFPHIHVEIDWRRGWESLDKELAEIRPAGQAGKLLADKLFKVWLKNGRPAWLLIHIEVQGRGGRAFSKRVFFYNFRLMDDQKAEVVSLAVLTDDRPGVTGSYDVGRWGCSHSFRFPFIRVIDFALRWGELETSDNVFAPVIMAQLKALETKGDNEQRYIWKRRLIFRLYDRGYDRQKIINLFRFMDWVMKLPSGLEQRLKQEVYAVKEERKMPYISTIERMAMQEGFQQGLLTTVIPQLTHRFGELSATLQSRLKKLSPKQIQDLSVALLDFKVKADLTAWLKQHAPQNSSPRKRK